MFPCTEPSYIDVKYSLSSYTVLEHSKHSQMSDIPKILTAASIRPIVLATLSAGEAYGYQLSKRIEYISGGEIETDTASSSIA